MVPVGWSVSRIAMVVVMSGSLRWDGMGERVGVTGLSLRHEHNFII